MINSQISVKNQRKDPYRVVKEKLAGSQAVLTCFFFRRGGNIYVISQKKNGKTSHILVDTGDPRHQSRILEILRQNDIDPLGIKRMIITHRHVDHSGLADLLATESQATIMVHAGFRSFIDGELDSHEKIWFGDFQASRLKSHNLEYMDPTNGFGKVSISGIDFPFLTKPLDIEGKGKLYILGCPESTMSHSPDQVVLVYSARPDPFKDTFQNGFRPTDDVVFAGDLWLMQGPFHHLRLDDIPRLLRFWTRSRRFQGKRRNHREQDAAAKEALKRFFTVVRVKPGHSDEFIGSRIIPNGILADRDILLELGNPANGEKPVLTDPALAPKVATILERAYQAFIKEIRFWLQVGYTPADVSELLQRIYREQSGGAKMVKRDRLERKARLKDNLNKMSSDPALNDKLHNIAQNTLRSIK